MFKKILTVTLVAAMAVTMVGCSSKVKVGEGEVKLAPYKGIVVYTDDITCKDEDYEAIKENFLSSCVTNELQKSGTVKKDSIVNVDYVGKIEVNGEMVAFDGGTSSTAVDIDMANDGTRYIEGFVDALKGHEVGEEFTAHLQFPETYDGTTVVNDETIELAGMPVDFTFTIHGLQKEVTPEFTDELVKEKSGLADVNTVEEFEEYVRNNQRSSNIIAAVWSNYLDECEVVTYDEKEMDDIEKTYEESISSSYGVTIEEYLEACGMTEEEWDEQLRSEVKNRMVIKAIAKKEGLLITDEEYETEATKLAEQYGVDLATYESYYGGRDYIELTLNAQRVQDFIVENVKEKEGSAPTTKAEETTTVAE